LAHTHCISSLGFFQAATANVSPATTIVPQQRAGVKQSCQRQLTFGHN
jgi:hypothetical protein